MSDENKTDHHSHLDNLSDLNHFDNQKYSEFIKANITSVIEETYNITFQKIIELNTSSIINEIHQKMTSYIYNQKTNSEIDLEGEEYKNFTKKFESNLNKNLNGCWCGTDSDTELKRCSKNVIIRTINMYIDRYKLIYIKNINLPYRSTNSNISKDIYLYIFSNKIIVFQFRFESFTNRTEQYITMYSYSYNFIPQFIIDIFNLVDGFNRDSNEDNQILTPTGFDIFMIKLDSLLKKFEQNPFYFASENSRFHQDIINQKNAFEIKLEHFKKEQAEFTLEKEKVYKLKEELETSLEIANKLEEIKRENLKRLKILKKIKEEKLLIENERKKLEEIRQSLNENSDIDLDELV
jgi:hypothetical protein